MPSLVRRVLLALLLGASVHSVASDNAIVLQSTTSTANSGLYDFILPRFFEHSGIRVHVVAVGTGQAIKNARNGDGDVLLTHARSAEEAFVAEGFGVERLDVMYNDFVIVGPSTDPAGVADSANAADALTRIAEARAVFVSRGDDSGTHTKERALWARAGVDPSGHSGRWYRETGQGMGATLNVALGMGAYTLVDRATWLSFNNKGGHRIVVQSDDALFNQYGVMLVNPKRHSHVKAGAGKAFIDWLIGRQGQQAIAQFRLGGEQLFFPNAAAIKGR